MSCYITCYNRFFLGTWSMSGFLSENRPIRTLREILNRLRETYCGNIGYEVSWASGVRLHTCVSDSELQELQGQLEAHVCKLAGFLLRSWKCSEHALR
jgi:hypothetical protein